ncbi:YbhB/YbcL family Raf kinase inhibitor-like protein [Sphingobacteriaceae bacterium]|nr:YbhB/YbcL family Raf kinase inhibitor-like protein [Sphingobacteriaceae bacterium]
MIRLCTFFIALYFGYKQVNPGLLVQSTSFANTHYIPYRYTCDGENVSPELRVTQIPKNTKTLALILIDSSAAFGEFDHWVVWNLPPTAKIAEKSTAGVTGRNSRRENKYMGPCPPNGIHEYRFRLYALDTELELPDSTGKENLVKAMQGHVLASGELVGKFQRQ